MISALKTIAEMIADSRRAEIHDVELVERPALARRRVGGGEDRRQDREVLGDVVGDRERRQRAARDQQLLADLDDLDQLRRVGVEVDHVPGLARGLGAGVHRHADVGLRERRRVVGAVAGHRDQPAARPAARGSARAWPPASPRRGSRRRPASSAIFAAVSAVVAGDHHRADAHRAQLVEALAHALLDDVLEVDDAEHLAVARDGQRRAALARDRGRARPASSGGAWPPSASTQRRIASPAPLRSRVPSRSTPLIRVCGGERDERARSRSASSRSRMP